MDEYKKESLGTLFTSEATARNTDPETSQIAADKMNKGDNLRKSQLAVLQGISEFPGLDAQSIGVEVAHKLTGADKELIRRVMSIIRPFEKRTPELVAKEFVTREQKGDKLIIDMTDKGWMYLGKRQ